MVKLHMNNNNSFLLFSLVPHSFLSALHLTTHAPLNPCGEIRILYSLHAKNLIYSFPFHLCHIFSFFTTFFLLSLTPIFPMLNFPLFLLLSIYIIYSWTNAAIKEERNHPSIIRSSYFINSSPKRPRPRLF